MIKIFKAFKKDTIVVPETIDDLIMEFMEEDNEILLLERMKIMKANGVKSEISPIMYLYNHGDPSKLIERTEKISAFSKKQDKILDMAMPRIKLCAFMRGFQSIYQKGKIQEHYHWCPYPEWAENKLLS